MKGGIFVTRRGRGCGLGGEFIPETRVDSWRVSEVAEFRRPVKRRIEKIHARGNKISNIWRFSL